MLSLFKYVVEINTSGNNRSASISSSILEYSNDVEIELRTVKPKIRHIFGLSHQNLGKESFYKAHPRISSKIIYE